MLPELNNLQNRIDYSFANSDLLRLALTHSSAGVGVLDNQRLEFLGDAVLGIVVAEWLFTTHPDIPEGNLDHMRASIVNGESLAKLARSLDLTAALKVSDAQQKHLPEPSDSMLEDALEALLGAIYLDGGLEAARRFIETHFEKLLKEATTNSLHSNPKGRLQEWTQKHHAGAIPVYTEIERIGPDHDRSYNVSVTVDDQTLGEGSGSSIKEAERYAAVAALEALSRSK